jgi:hypothetical protein
VVGDVSRSRGTVIMRIYGKQRGNLVPVHKENVNTNDWLVLLEAATIVGQKRDKVRVALTTKERKVVKRRKLFRTPEHFLIVDGYDPRIHALYFCPQLYKNEDGELVALSGQEMGQLMAKALEAGALEKPPWYEPSESIPKEPVIKSTPEMELDTLVVDAPIGKANRPTALRSVALPDKQKTNT